MVKFYYGFFFFFQMQIKTIFQLSIILEQFDFLILKLILRIAAYFNYVGVMINLVKFYVFLKINKYNKLQIIKIKK